MLLLPIAVCTVEPLNADSLKCRYLVILDTSCRNGLIFNRNVLIHTPEKRTPRYSVNQTLCSMLIGITQYNCHLCNMDSDFNIMHVVCFLASCMLRLFSFPASLGRPWVHTGGKCKAPPCHSQHLTSTVALLNVLERNWKNKKLMERLAGTCPTTTAVFTTAIPLGGPWYWLALSLGLELLPPLAARFLAIGMIAPDKGRNFAIWCYWLTIHAS